MSTNNPAIVAVEELIPAGKLRVGAVSAPELSTFFIVTDENGKPRGVTVDLANELAHNLGVPVEFTVLQNSGLVADSIEVGALDVTFMPVGDARRKRVDVGPAYYMVESTYMVTGSSAIKR